MLANQITILSTHLIVSSNIKQETSAQGDATVNNEQLRRELDQLKDENEMMKNENKKMRAHNDVLKDKNQQLNSLWKQTNAENESTMQQLNVKSNKISHLETELHQVKVSQWSVTSLHIATLFHAATHLMASV